MGECNTNVSYTMHDITEERAKELQSMDYAEKSYIHELIERECHMEDCKDHIEFLMEDGDCIYGLDQLTGEDLNAICTRFEDNHDCTVPDADQWNCHIKEYLKEHYPYQGKKCPKCGSTEFNVTRHVSQTIRVGGNGQFLKLLSDADDILHDADNHDHWTCAKCGYEAAGIVFEPICNNNKRE